MVVILRNIKKKKKLPTTKCGKLHEDNEVNSCNAVLGALMEYAAILLLLKKRRKPLRTIDQGLRQLFRASNGAAALPLADTTTREVTGMPLTTSSSLFSPHTEYFSTFLSFL